MEREEELEERGEGRDELLWRAKIAALAQERNTLLLELLAVARDVAKDVHEIAAALPQPPGQLKNLSTIFGLPK
jgi:dihydroxyacetone kinase